MGGGTTLYQPTVIGFQGVFPLIFSAPIFRGLPAGNRQVAGLNFHQASWWMCIYIYVYTHVSICIYIYIFIYISIYTYLSVVLQIPSEKGFQTPKNKSYSLRRCLELQCIYIYTCIDKLSNILGNTISITIRDDGNLLGLQNLQLLLFNNSLHLYSQKVTLDSILFSALRFRHGTLSTALACLACLGCLGCRTRRRTRLRGRTCIATEMGAAGGDQVISGMFMGCFWDVDGTFMDVELMVIRTIASRRALSQSQLCPVHSFTTWPQLCICWSDI